MTRNVKEGNQSNGTTIDNKTRKKKKDLRLVIVPESALCKYTFSRSPETLNGFRWREE